MKLLSAVLIGLGLAGCGSAHFAGTIVPTSSVAWEHLNPARGDKSPSAGTLWGDRNGTVATGYLLRPTDGFRSPPHIHNVSYRAVVIRGLIHNADPNAAELWMGPGSFWTQPKGGVHITAAKGRDTLAYIEIDEGPYLVRPVEQAFETKERPVNVDASNVVWVDAPTGYRVAYLWGTPGAPTASGVLIELRSGTTAPIESRSAIRAVVISGQLSSTGPGTALEPGSYIHVPANSALPLACAAGPACVLYLRIDGKMDLF